MILSFEEFKNFTPKKDTYALFGYPLNHTMSPELHEELFKSYNYDADYIAVEVPSNKLSEAFSIAKARLKGINITIPYKKEIIQFVDIIENNARIIESVNTIHFTANKSYAYNTDIMGFEESLKKDNVTLKDKQTLILGYGGASHSIAFHCLSKGAKLTIAGRNQEKANELIKKLNTSYPRNNINFSFLDNPPTDCEIVINCTPVGMFPNESVSPIKEISNKVEYIFDAIYNPPKTKLLKLAKKNAKTRDGLFMLVMQAVKAQEIWTNKQIAESTYINVLRKLYGKLALKRLQNVNMKKSIFLCGYMGSGKTTIGKKLSKILELPFIDADIFLENAENRKIADIFEQNGEAYFRNLETKYLKEMCKYSGAVIALGGGAVLKQENVNLIKNTGILIYLNTPFFQIVKNLSNDSSRPLLFGDNKEEKMKKIYNERKKIYSSVSDICVSSNIINSNIDQILKSI